MSKYGISTRLGFDDRMFLTAHEWNTFRRVLPVRYIKKKKDNVCIVCGQAEAKDNPFHSSHMIPFSLGITHLGLTPDFVNGDHNIVTAHAKKCNKKSEISLEKCMEFLIAKGVEKLPYYLPEQIHNIWLETLTSM